MQAQGRSPSPRSRPRGLRMDLLATRVVTLDEFLHQEEQSALDEQGNSLLKPIPVLLAANESMADYERDFERFLVVRNVSLNSLQSCPGVERLFRLDYTNAKFMELRRRNIAMGTRPQLCAPLSVQISDHKGAWEHDLGPNLRNSDGLRGRKELLATCVVPPDVFLKTMEHYGPNGRINLEQPLRAIAIVLRPGETCTQYEGNFKRWLSKKKVTLDVLAQDPEEERRFRQCFAYARAYESKHRALIRSKLNEKNNVTVKAKKRPRLDVDTTRTSPLESEEVVVTADADSDNDNDAASGTSSTTISEPPFTPRSADDGEPGDWQFFGVKLEHGLEMEQRLEEVHEGMAAAVERNVQGKKSNADIYHSAALVLASSGEVEWKDSGDARLAGPRENTANVVNVKVAENMRQIAELKEVVNQEQQRRDAVLASIVALEWKDRGNELEQLVPESADNNEEVEISYRKLVATYEKLEQQRNEILTLKIKLKNRLRWLKPTDTDRDPQFQELQEIANLVAAAMSHRSLLDDERRNLCLMLLRSNGKLRLLVADAVEEAGQVWDTGD